MDEDAPTASPAHSPARVFTGRARADGARPVVADDPTTHRARPWDRGAADEDGSADGRRAASGGVGPLARRHIGVPCGSGDRGGGRGDCGGGTLTSPSACLPWTLLHDDRDCRLGCCSQLHFPATNRDLRRSTGRRPGAAAADRTTGADGRGRIGVVRRPPAVPSRPPLRRGLLAVLVCGLALVAGCSAKVPQRIDRAAHVGPSPTASQAATGGAPAKPFPVGVRTFTLTETSDRVLRTTVWYPAIGRGGSGASVAAGRFPVVVFSHGLLALPTDYRDLLTRWAAAGFVVVAPAYPHTSRGVASFEVVDVVHQPADASFVLTRVLALNGARGDPFAGHLDAERLAAAGHSGGAITTVGLFASGRDDRLRAGIVLAGNALGMGSSYRGPPAALLFVHGDRDPITPYGLGQAAYAAVPGGWPKAFLTLTGQGHTDPYLRPSAAGFRTVATTTTDFLRWTLYHDPAAKQRLAVDAGGAAVLDDRL
jgi:fermentation-respiration switch protein FrsA (DUF1100 family)